MSKEDQWRLEAMLRQASVNSMHQMKICKDTAADLAPGYRRA